MTIALKLVDQNSTEAGHRNGQAVVLKLIAAQFLWVQMSVLQKPFEYTVWIYCFSLKSADTSQPRFRIVIQQKPPTIVIDCR